MPVTAVELPRCDSILSWVGNDLFLLLGKLDAQHTHCFCTFPRVGGETKKSGVTVSDILAKGGGATATA